MTELEPEAGTTPKTKWFRTTVYMPELGAFPAEITLQPPPRRPAPRFTPAVMADVARVWHRMHEHHARRGAPEAVWDLAFDRGEIVVHDYDFPDRSEATPYTETRIALEDDGFYHFGCGALPWSLQPEPWPRKQRDLARILADPEARVLHAAFLAAEDTPYCDERELAYRRLAHTLLALGTPLSRLPAALDALAAAARHESAVPAPAPSTTDRKGDTDEA